MNSKFFLILLFCFSFFALDAQMPNFGRKKGPTIKGTIKGKILDKATGEAVPYATISLRKAGKPKIIDGILSEENGSFSLKEVVNGKYDLTISFLGYEELVLNEVEVTLKHPTANLESIKLNPANIVLDEVNITADRALLESKADKIIYNAEDDATVSGGDATDVLRNVPMLSVDLDGNVSMRGSQNVTILINGRPSGMFSSNVAEALKMFPADQIKKVEVITSPGAKYDGEGSAGIINIITKKSDIEGIAGSINTSLGNRLNSMNASLNAGRGRFGFSSNGSIRYSLPADASSEFYREDNTTAGLRIITQDGINETSRLGFRTSASAFYDFNAFNSLNTSFSYRGFGFDREGFIDGIVNDPLNNFENSFHRDDNSNNLYSGYDWNTDYIHKFENNEDQEFSMAFQLSGNVQNQEYDLNEIHDISLFNRNEQVDNEGDNVEATFQLDYIHPFSKKLKLEIGAKSVIRNIDSDYKYMQFNDVTNDYQVDQLRSNIFLYDQDVYAGYGQINYTLGKYNFITGVRYEHTTIHGDFENGEATFTNNYDNLLPNFTISRPLKNFRTVRLSYNQRIQRPSLYYINPFSNSLDRVNQTVGNPALNPELTHQVELAYNFRFLGFNIFSAAFVRKTEDQIEQILQINDIGLSINTYENVGESRSIGLNVFTSKSIGRLTLRLGGDLYNYDVTGIVNGESLSNNSFNYRLFTNGEYAITGDFKMDFFGMFNAPRYTLQGQRASFSMYVIGFRKDFKNASLGIRLVEPFTADKSFDSELAGADFYQNSSFAIPFRSVGINFRYKFGKVDFKERRNKIKNTDLKSGEGQQGQEGAGNSNQRGKK